MLELHHDEEHPVLEKFRKALAEGKVGNRWKDFRDFAAREYGRNPLYGRLHSLQHGLCVYCERKVYAYPDEVGFGLGRQIEHLKCRTHYPHKMFEYSNMALSCLCEGKIGRGRLTCGSRKSDRDLPLLPTDEHAHLFALSTIDGSLVPALGITAEDAERVRQCIQILNLNDPVLCQERLRVVLQLRELQADESRQDRVQNFCLAVTRDGEPFAPTLRRLLAAFLP